MRQDTNPVLSKVQCSQSSMAGDRDLSPAAFEY